MIILGLTGGAASGKSTASSMFRELGVPVHDADACVHRLLAEGGAGVAPVAAHFPESLRGAAIDRKSLGAEVFADPESLRLLESILHPLVREEEERFIGECRTHHEPIVVLDIPLLFETGADARCDFVVTMTLPRVLQRQRIMARPGMTQAKMEGILARQWPQWKRDRHADYLLHSAYGFDYTRREVRRLVHQLRTGWIYHA